jgi:hypothetical protein
MALGSLRRMLHDLRRQAQRLPTKSPVLTRLGSDPTTVLTEAGLNPDAWQREVFQSKQSRLLMLATRQAGKSTVAAALALDTALVKPCSPVLILSPSTRQSGELFRKVLDLFNGLGRPMAVVAESALRIEFGNGSRVLSLPSTEATVRCFSGVALLVIDEAARVPDALYFAVVPCWRFPRGGWWRCLRRSASAAGSTTSGTAKALGSGSKSPPRSVPGSSLRSWPRNSVHLACAGFARNICAASKR